MSFRAHTVLLVACFYVFSLFSRQIFASENTLSDAVVVIVNQVRGTRCCEPGSVEHLRMQLNALQDLKFPATFAFRYDALQDSAFVDVFSSVDVTYEPALFLEITPDLAQAAQVTQPSNGGQWYKAQSAYLLGYSQEERKKLIDTTMQAYFTAFHRYPKTTVAWMIDAWSLNYLSEKYGVVAHELTREQWGTDSYTLYGGPQAVSYKPSRQWPLIPAVGKDALPVTIMRQTVPDPVWNYGDTTSATTSQPNDYVLAGKDIGYFQHLVQQAIGNETGPGFAVIGLENSMTDEHQQAFKDQLKFIAGLQKTSAGKMQVLNAATFVEQQAQRTQKTVQLYAGTNAFREDLPLNTRAWWVTTPRYRVRLVQKDQQILLDDLRVYDSGLQDPYTQQKLSTPNAYWIVPFLVDGSRFRKSEKILDQHLNRFQKLWLQLTKQPLPVTHRGEARTDLETDPIGLQFPRIAQGETVRVEQSQNTVLLSYRAESGDEITITLGEDSFVVVSSEKPSWNVAEDELPGLDMVELQEKVDGKRYTFTPKLRGTTPSVRAPEDQRHPANLERSRVFITNRGALLDRNPIRVAVFLRDDASSPTVSTKPPTLRCDGAGCGEVVMQQPDTAKGEYYLDVQPQHTGLLHLHLEVEGQDADLGWARVSLNCRVRWSSCAKHPIELLGYLATLTMDRLYQRQ